MLHALLSFIKERLGSASFCNQGVRLVLRHDEQYEGKLYLDSTLAMGH